MTPFLKQVKSQGWKLYEIGNIRGLKKTRMAEISKSPTQWDWLALKGLGDKRERKCGDCDWIRGDQCYINFGCIHKNDIACGQFKARG